MNVMTKKHLLLSLVLTAFAMSSVYAGREGKKCCPLKGSWNMQLFLPEVAQKEDEAKEENNNEIFSILGVIKFDEDGTLVADGLVPFFVTTGLNTINGRGSSIAVGTWKRIAKRLFVIEASTVFDGFDDATEANQIGGSLRLKTRALVRLDECCRTAEIFDVRTQAFGPHDTCFEEPLGHFFPTVQGELCKLSKPRKVVKGNL